MWNENQFNLTHNERLKKAAEDVNRVTCGSYQAKTSGAYGEFQLASVVEMLPKEYHIINNVLLDTTKKKRLSNGKVIRCGNQTSTQIDHIIVSPYGLFVVETKNYKGLIFGDCDGVVWTQVLNNGRHYTFYNPVKQNEGHLINLYKQLHIKTNLMQGLIVFTNNEANRVHVNCPFCITGEQLLDYLLSFRGYAIMSEKAVYRIIEQIDKINNHGYINEQKHVDYVQQQKARYEYYRDRKKGIIK